MNSETALCRLSWLLAAGVFAGSFAALGAELNFEKSFQVSPGGTLVLDADQGYCEVVPTDGTQVQIRVLQHAKQGTEAQQQQLLANHEVTFEQDGGTVAVRAKAKKNLYPSWGPRPPYLEVHYEVRIPKRFDVDLTTSGGDLRVGDLDGTAKTHTSSGSIHLKRITGNVRAEDSGGDINIDEAGGDLAAATSSGAIRVQKVGGKAKLSDSGGDIHLGEALSTIEAKTSSGSIYLKTVKGDAEVNNSGGDITIEQAGGEVTATTSSGSVHLGRVAGKRVNASNAGGDITLEEAEGSLQARTSSGSIKLKHVKGTLVARNSGGDISIDEAGNTLSAETSSGSINIGHAKGAVEVENSGGNIDIGEAGAQVSARTSSGSLHIKSARGQVDARNSGGNIDIGAAQRMVRATTSSGAITAQLTAQPTEECRFEVSGGSIKLLAPKSLAANLDARSSGGEVSSEIPVTTSTVQRPDPSALQGKLNGGGPALYLRSSSGDIHIKATPALPAPLEVEEPVK